MTNNWDQDICLQLLSEFRKHELLWNSKHKSYYNAIKKEETWQLLSDTLQRSVQDVKRKMESLRGSFRRERNRARRFRNSFTGEEYTSHWFAYESMKFLEDVGDDSKKSNGNTKEEDVDIADHDLGSGNSNNGDFLQDNETYEYTNWIPYKNMHFLDDQEAQENLTANIKMEDQSNSENDNIVSNTIILSESDGLNENQKRQHSTFIPPLKLTKKHKSSTENRKITDALKLVHDINSQKDESAIYGEYITIKLRKFNDLERAELEHKINNLIYEAEIAKLNNS